MFRSKFSILLLISYHETYENVAEIIVNQQNNNYQQKNYATLILIIYRSNLNKSINNKFS